MKWIVACIGLIVTCLVALIFISAWGNADPDARSYYPWLLGGVVLIGISGTGALRFFSGRRRTRGQ